MNITKKKLTNIMNQYWNISNSLDSDDVENVFHFISDVLIAEAQTAETRGTESAEYIGNCKTAATMVSNLFWDIISKLEDETND